MSSSVNSSEMQSAIFGGGCFWCTEAVFQQIRGVQLVQSGYSGGAVHQPTYEQICSGKTGHAEVVRISFNPQLISYPELLEIFFATHDPTTLNRQGNDRGTQYRSVVYYLDEQQKLQAQQVMEKMQALWEAPIVTELTMAPQFYLAEDYHQNYFNQHPEQGYCAMLIAPKVAKLRKQFAHKIIA